MYFFLVSDFSLNALKAATTGSAFMVSDNMAAAMRGRRIDRAFITAALRAPDDAVSYNYIGRYLDFRFGLWLFLSPRAETIHR